MKRLKIDPIDILNKELKALKGKEDSKSQNLRVRIAEKLIRIWVFKNNQLVYTNSGSGKCACTYNRKQTRA